LIPPLARRLHFFAQKVFAVNFNPLKRNGQELEFENFEFEDSEWSGEGEVFSEAELMELAGELLEINSEAELDQWWWLIRAC
jgi:hypothetical protein